jgi:AbiV family abortive infection protein
MNMSESNRDTFNDNKVQEAISACVSNGFRLLDDADFLGRYDGNPTVYALYILAQEEFAKAFLLHLVRRKVIPWNSSIRQALNDHKSKHLIGLIVAYLEPPFEEWINRHKEWMEWYEAWKEAFKEGKILERDERFPPSITSALDFFRYEKIGRWEKTFWGWDEDDPGYDKEVQKLGEGALDSKKQNAIYVRLGKDGQIAGKPTPFTTEVMDHELELARRLGGFARSIAEHGTPNSADYSKIEDAFAVLFGMSEVSG